MAHSRAPIVLTPAQQRLRDRLWRHYLWCYYRHELAYYRGLAHDTAWNEWEESKHPRKSNGEFTWKGMGEAGAGPVKPGSAPDRAALEAYAASLDKAEREGTGPYAAHLRATAQQDVPGARPLGPRDIYGEQPPSWEERAKSLFGLSRNQRIQQVTDLLAKRQYDKVIDQYFPIRMDQSIFPEEYAAHTGKIRDALRTMLGTNTGARIAIALAHKGVPGVVMVTDIPRRSEAVPLSNTVNIDVNFAVSIFERLFALKPEPPAKALAAIIAHEFGHAVMGYKDIGFDPKSIQRDRQIWLQSGTNSSNRKFPHPLSYYLQPGDNVTYVENPIRRELGLPPRKSYISESQLHDIFPELFANTPKAKPQPARGR